MAIVHVRIVCPPDLGERVAALLGADPCVFGLAAPPGAAHNPDGVVLHCDVLTGALSALLEQLRRLGVERRGSIMVDEVELALCDLASRTESGLGRFAYTPVWQALEARIDADARYVPTFYLLLTVAGVIGAIGIVTNSQILIVAAMVVGPEFGAIASVAAGLGRRSRAAVRRGITALVLGFSLAVLATYLFSLLVRAFDLESRAYSLGLRPVSSLIDKPNFFSVVIAVLAGVVGIVSLTQARASALLGVFISVTTIPAAADIGVSCAFSSWSEARGSLLQLLLNVVLLILAGLFTLKSQRLIWRWNSRRAASGPAAWRGADDGGADLG